MKNDVLVRILWDMFRAAYNENNEYQMEHIMLLIEKVQYDVEVLS